MWHKVNPIAFRIPYIKTWKSTWYEDKKTYKDSLNLDLKVRDILKAELTWIPLWDILVSINNGVLTVVVYTAKASLILGKTGEHKTEIEDKITNKVWIKTTLEIREVKKPDTNAKIVWFMVANQIEKRLPYKRAIKQAIQKAMEKWAKW